MGLSLLALFIIFAAVIGSAAVTGFLFYLFSRLRRLEGGGYNETAPLQISDQMTGIVEELMALQEKVTNLSERLDFTEKLLTGGERGPTESGTDREGKGSP